MTRLLTESLTFARLVLAAATGCALVCGLLAFWEASKPAAVPEQR